MDRSECLRWFGPVKKTRNRMMVRRPRAHSAGMVQRILAALGLSSCVLACSNTTSLGGPTQKSSPASVGDEAVPAEASAPPDEKDSSSSPAGGLRCVSVGYSWGPEPSATECQFFVPPDPGGDPDYNPVNWNLDRIRTEMWIEGESQSTQYGYYVGSRDACGDGHGWFYVPADDRTPTLFEICPESCALAAQEDVYFRLALHKPCSEPGGE